MNVKIYALVVTCALVICAGIILRERSEIERLRLEGVGLRAIRSRPLRVMAASNGEISMQGQVQFPARYRISSGCTISEALDAAGGFTPTAKRNGVRITRVQSPFDLTTLYTADFASKPTQQGRNVVGRNFVLEAKDLIYVPEEQP